MPISRAVLDGFIESVAIDDVEAEELLLGFGERAIDDERLAAVAQRGGGGRRHQAGDRAELALPRRAVA